MTMKIKETALYTLDELNDKAQERAYNEWLDEYRDSYEWTCDVVYSDAVHYGDKALASVGINAEWDSWDNCFPGNYADPDSGRYLPYITAADYLPDNAREICHMEGYGFCSSMDMADAFNAYEPRLLALIKAYETATKYDDLIIISEHFARVHREACETACRVFHNCFAEEKEYYESMEHFEDETTQGGEWRTRDNSGRVYYSDNRKWYTADGEFYEQSDVSNECVSIVKAS